MPPLQLGLSLHEAGNRLSKCWNRAPLCPVWEGDSSGAPNRRTESASAEGVTVHSALAPAPQYDGFRHSSLHASAVGQVGHPGSVVLPPSDDMADSKGERCHHFLLVELPDRTPQASDDCLCNLVGITTPRPAFSSTVSNNVFFGLDQGPVLDCGPDKAQASPANRCPPCISPVAYSLAREADPKQVSRFFLGQRLQRLIKVRRIAYQCGGVASLQAE